VGVVLSLYVVALLLLGQQSVPKARLIKLLAVGDFLWVLCTAVWVATRQWVTELDGITAAGLVAIIVGWFGWLQWQYATQD